jgi:hypothetical protein
LQKLQTPVETSSVVLLFGICYLLHYNTPIRGELITDNIIQGGPICQDRRKGSVKSYSPPFPSFERIPYLRIKRSVYLLNTLQQESGNQGPDEAADDYKTRNTCSTAGELLWVRYSHASRLLHI